ncbi:restriction endonuclease subunit S [Accumulibacter sp.]|uniref:restriction endonuclease subunit S n=1 Tax=Accumulibacter sp. TaxID=2053492 RepID=UPI002583C84B|nr:restriction endonuclease subunit S [Accumulibacter sp.]
MDFDEAHFAKYQLTPGDILVSEGQSPELLGQSAVFRGFTEPLCFQKTLHRFRAHPGTTTPEFAQIVFRSHVRSGVFRRLGSITTNIGHLTLEKFKAAPFPLPPLDEQHRIVAEVDRRLSIVREVDAEVGANLRRAQALRQAVLVQAFSGEALNTEMTPRSRATALANAA